MILLNTYIKVTKWFSKCYNCLGFRVYALGFRVWVSGLEFRVLGL